MELVGTRSGEDGNSFLLIMNLLLQVLEKLLGFLLADLISKVDPFPLTVVDTSAFFILMPFTI